MPMQVKKYRADSMKEALESIKKELGPEALIIETRKVRSKGILGFFQPLKVEVTAVLEGTSKQLYQPKAAEIDSKVMESTVKEVARLKEMINTIKSESALSTVIKSPEEVPQIKPLELIKKRLLDTGMSLDSVGCLLKELIFDGVDLYNVAAVENGIYNVLKKSLKTKTPMINKKPYLILLVGTTGVGKTTTIAKLAAKYHLKEDHKVGLITIDTYRIAAVEQLKTYAEIINIPLEVAFNKDDYQKALQRFKEMDLIFVDTAGRSQHNMIQVGELREFIAAQKPAEIHLVISATSKIDDYRSIVAAFVPLGVTHLIYSKADETLKHGALFEILTKTQIPLSFITTGQKVPEDLETASVEKVIELITGD